MHYVLVLLSEGAPRCYPHLSVCVLRLGEGGPDLVISRRRTGGCEQIRSRGPVKTTVARLWSRRGWD